MKQKYNLNDEVEVRFMGKVTEIKVVGGRVRYCVTGDNIRFAMVDENDIAALMTPEDLKTEMQQLADDLQEGLGDKNVPY